MINFYLQQFGWLLPILGVFLLTIGIHIIISFVYKRVLPRIEKSHLSWDSALLKALITPLKLLIWVIGLSFIIQMLSIHFESEAFIGLFTSFRNFCFIAIALWLVLRFIKGLETDYIRGKRQEKKHYDKTTIRAVCQIARISAIIIAILIYLQTRDINISAVLAFGGAGGIVVGLAARDLLANFFGGLMIYLDRPFSVGDWIRSSEKEIEGYVEHIGWRLTRIRTFDKRPLYVPNGLFSNITVENPSRMSHRRIKTRVGIRYQDAFKIEEIAKEIEEMLKTHPDIDSDQTIMVRFDEFAPYSLNLFISAFTKATKRPAFLSVQQDVFLKILDIIKNRGAECAFPTTTLHMPEGVTIHE
jgi:MscS family membrane protein